MFLYLYRRTGSPRILLYTAREREKRRTESEDDDAERYRRPVAITGWTKSYWKNPYGPEAPCAESYSLMNTDCRSPNDPRDDLWPGPIFTSSLASFRYPAYVLFSSFPARTWCVCLRACISALVFPAVREYVIELPKGLCAPLSGYWTLRCPSLSLWRRRHITFFQYPAPMFMAFCGFHEICPGHSSSELYIGESIYARRNLINLLSR